MASRRIPAAAVVRFFEGDENHLPEVFCEGSDDELGMEEYSDSEEEQDGTTQYNLTEMVSKQCIAQNATDEWQTSVVLHPLSASAIEGRDKSVLAHAYCTSINWCTYR